MHFFLHNLALLKALQSVEHFWMEWLVINLGPPFHETRGSYLAFGVHSWLLRAPIQPSQGNPLGDARMLKGLREDCNDEESHMS